MNKPRTTLYDLEAQHQLYAHRVMIDELLNIAYRLSEPVIDMNRRMQAQADLRMWQHMWHALHGGTTSHEDAV